MGELTTDLIRKLHQKKYRQQAGYFLAEGEHLVQELEKASEFNLALQASELLVTERFEGWPGRLRKRVVSETLMSKLTDTRSPQGIIACVPMAAIQSGSGVAAKAERSVYFHEIQDPGNLGTILRTLAWFGGFRCLLSPGSVDPFNSKVVRASMGAIFHVPVECDITPGQLQLRHADIACLGMQGESLKSAAFRHSRCLVFGNEARGMPADLISMTGATVYSIPGSGAIDSLNLASAVNMSIYELMR